MSARWTLAALVGATNAGKTSLARALAGASPGAITHKANTTRVCARVATMVGEVQVALVDAPGEPRGRGDALDAMIQRAAFAPVEWADSVVVVVDSSRRDAFQSAQRTLDRIRAARKRAFAALNKTDRISGERALTLAKTFWDTGIIDEVFMTSATRSRGLKPLLRALAAGPTRPGRGMAGARSLDDPSLAAEITREALFRRFHDELPYGMAVKPEAWRDLRSGRVRIEQTALVTRERHRRMLIGRGGAALRAAGQEARLEMERAFERGVDLFVHARVAPWRATARGLWEAGLRDDGGLV